MFDKRQNDLTFKDKWNNYSKSFWTPIFKHIEEPVNNIFLSYNIVLWGCIPYPEYQKSKFYFKTNIHVLNKELKVYFYSRFDIHNQYLHFFFVNTIDSKNKIMSTKDKDLDSDRLLLKRLHEHNLSIYKIFNHPFSKNCWEAMLEEF